MMTKFFKNKKIIAILIILIVLIGGALFVFRNYIFASPPERTVMNFLGAIQNKNFDKAISYVWPAERDKFLTSGKILENVSNISDSNVKIKFTGLKYKTIKIDNNSAEINASGKLDYQFFNAQKQVPFNRNFKLIKENKQWYIKSLL